MVVQIRQAVAAGHTLADVARAAGCTRPSLYRHLEDQLRGSVVSATIDRPFPGLSGQAGR